MEHLYPSKTRPCLAFGISIILHLLVMLLIIHQSLHRQHQPFVSSDQKEDDRYLAQTLLSSGQQPPAAVLFQDEAPSGKDLVSSPVQEITQPAQEIEQQAAEKPAPPLDEPVEETKTTTADSFEQPMPTPQAPEQPTTKAVPQQQASPSAQRRTTNNHSMTLADVSRGFIKNMQQEAGHNQAARDTKQLALQMYATKIWNLIKNAFLAGDNGLHLPEAVSVHALLVLTVDRSGTLVNIHLEYPKHITALRNIERLVVSRAHQAGLFPPLPAQIPGTSKTSNFPLFIEGQAGFHAYSLGYQ